ncbi:MAG: fumarylacetoacetate hydrolase family protein [Bacteroidales bacterium]|nr:fumarylacetoacetate hydrolase family protein [Bacteroidales bacterium]
MKILCIGRNYIDHAKELNNPVPATPVFFGKAENAILQNGKAFYYPNFSKDIHYETEIVVKINRLGKNIETQFANRYYEEIGIGIDFTARDLQNIAKKKGLPWEIAKAFDGSAPLGDFLPKSEFSDIKNINFSLDINGTTVQKGNTADMIFDIDYIISYLSQFYTLKIGDLIFTGTPVGVGPIKIGDKMIAKIEDKVLLEIDVK